MKTDLYWKINDKNAQINEISHHKKYLAKSIDFY